MTTDAEKLVSKNPMVSSPNKMKLGVFALNAHGGTAISVAPEVHKADNWPRSAEIIRAADQAGFEAMIPIGRWRGFGGESNFGGTSFETYTWAAGVAAITDQIACITTSHVPTVHPLLAAKQAATIDHISNGRFGLNIICGWFGPEMRMFGGKMMDHDDRYDYADEWIEVIQKAWTEKGYFDYKTKNFNLEQAFSEPKPLNKPFLINAGGSPRGMRYCAQHCDSAFIILGSHEPQAVAAQIRKYKDLARNEFGRDLKVWCYSYVSVAESLAQAQKYVDRYVTEFGDDEACENIVKELGIQTGIMTPEQADNFRYHFKGGWAGFPLVGTPEMIADHLAMLSDAGMDGVCLSWLDYKAGIAQWNAEVMPLLERAGLRAPYASRSLSAAA
ncbi:LLM class flavin-dependent oxidoreductase [Paraburkholderia rhynchosiae]|uniref:LLM class flavin-dependent oxidoreductase n=1 Tax=Paraburkholderia rhynchosiae TaxID=487049 RepID=A0A2N7W7U7_9BURK|nr:LLM class flavin-dependent oxidoreductase [Paraburkholderia rhynchosiae]PMS25486.1 LLM class flavin-dependent oxidoreductase [Paraburkholderia rhynchosiae]CAB3733977.1 Pyrimidine monooxygenase RutA [Paraburkholderia rhynchosiae]